MDRFSPVPEDDITPVGRSRSSSGSIFRRVRSFRDSSSSKEREKEKASRRPESPDPYMLNARRSQSAAVSSKSSRSSSKGSGTKDKQRSGGLRSVSSSPNRSKARNTLGVDVHNMRPNSPMGKPLKSALKKGGSPTHMNRSTSPPARSKSSERKNSGNVFSRLYPYPGSGGMQDPDEGISDSRFHGVNDTLRIRKKKDPSKTAMVDFDGPVSASHGGRHPQQSTQEEHDFLVSVHLQTYILVHTHIRTTHSVFVGVFTTHTRYILYTDHTYIGIYVRTYTEHVCIHMYIYMCICTYVCMCICTYMYVRMYTHVCIYVHT